MHVKRDERVTVARDLAQKARDLAFMKKKPSYTKRVFIKDIPLFIRRDMHSVDKHLTIVNFAIALLKIYLSLTDAFYLCAEQLYAGFCFFLYEILVIRFLVLRDYFCFSFLHTSCPPE